jgi:hypothetical protein
MALGGNVVNWQGVWLAGTTYLIFDAVEHLGSSYIAVDASTNIEPGTPAAVDFWELIAQGGAGLDWQEVYDNGVTYAINDGVSFTTGGATSSYISLVNANLGNSPDVSPTEWDLFASGGADGVSFIWEDLWEIGTQYDANDVVRYDVGSLEGASSWIALRTSTGAQPDVSALDWSLMAEGGQDGTDGTDGRSFIWLDLWDIGTAYAVDDVVSYDVGPGRAIGSFICTQANTGEAPPTDPATNAFWELMAQGGADGAGGDMFVSTYDATDGVAEQLLGKTAEQTITGKTIDSFTNIVVANATHLEVRNVSGSTLDVGDVVYISGFNVGADLPEVELADADGADTFPAVGIVTEEILNNSDGDLRTGGIMVNLDTSGFTEGDVVYLSTTAGAFDVRPTTQGTEVQALGIVLRSHATLGALWTAGFGDVVDDTNLDNHSVLAKVSVAAATGPVAIAADRLLGRAASGDIAGVQVLTNHIGTAQVSNAKLANMVTNSFKGRNTAATGVPEDILVDNAADMLANESTDPAKAVAQVGKENDWIAGQRKEVTPIATWATLNWNLNSSNDFDITADAATGNLDTPDVTGMTNNTAQAGEITLTAASFSGGFHNDWQFPGGSVPDLSVNGDYTLYYRVWKDGATPRYRITGLAAWGG